MDRAADDPALQPLIVLRVVIRSPDLETFVNKYSRFIKDDRIFIFTKSSQPSGTRVRFTLELADGQPLINGEGTVTRIRPDSGDASKPPGMELRFQPLDEPSRELVARMLAARELVGRMPDQQTAPISTGTDSQPIAIGGRFRDESTDVDDRLLPHPLPPRPKVIDSHPVLEPLQKTGNYDAIAEAEAARHDESGEVTLAQGGPLGARGADNAVQSGGYTSPDALPAGVRQMPSAPSQSLPSLPGLPTLPFAPAPSPPSSNGPSLPSSAPLSPAQLAKAAEERPSGNFSTPTPLPMPIPAGPSDEPAHLSAHLSPTRMDKLSAVARDDGTGAFAAVGPAPAFAEAFHAPLAPANGHSLPPPNGIVPANPFSEVSDGAIEYFVEWSMEQSTAPKPKAAASSFANVAMATPRKERRRLATRPLLFGTVVGLLFGIPIGAVGVWLWKPAAATVIVERMPEGRSAETRPVATPIEPSTPTGVAPPLPTPPVTTAAVKPIAAAEKTVTATEKSTPAMEKPAPATEKPVEKRPKPIVAAEPKDDNGDATAPKQQLQKEEPRSEGKAAALVAVQIASHPSGAAISVDGEARGKTPSTLQLAPGTHEVALAKERYATATQTVDAPGKLDVTLRRPTATLHVDSDPPGGDVVVEGKPRGKAPVDVTLDAFHHYDVQVSLLGTKPFHKRVALKPPQVDVNVKLEVVHKP